jgi:hypothetical protein
MQDFNLNLYRDDYENGFEIQVQNCISKLFGSEVNAVINHGYFILTKALSAKNDFIGVDAEGLCTWNDNGYLLHHDTILQQRNLALGKQLEQPIIKEPANYSVAMFKFKKFLLSYEYEWINKYSKHLKESLATRISEGIPIIKHEAVRLSWANLMERQESLQHLLKSIEDSPSAINIIDVYILAPCLIREACELLSKLAGGRAFLAKQAVEMLWLFTIFNKVYLGDPVKEKT